MSVIAPCAHRARHLAYNAVSCRTGRGGPPSFTVSRFVPRVAVVVASVIAYFGVRGLTDSSPASASRNADRVRAAEVFLHLDWESPLQKLVVDDPAITRILNWIYIFGHWPVIAATLLWLLSRHPEVYTRAAGAMLVSGAAGLAVFAAFPVAPPRLAAPGMTDTVTQQSHAYRVLQPPAFTNQYAAMPSLHVGWNLLMTLAVLAATRRVWLRVLAVLLTVAMDATVVLTANHYVLDALAGAALAHAGWHAAARLRTGRRAGSLPGFRRAGPPATASPATRARRRHA